MVYLSSYPTVFALGHPAIEHIFGDPVVIEEKIDGSQFSMGILGAELLCRSKGKDQTPPETDHLFRAAVDVAMTLPLHPGYTYRCEYLAKPKHNTLAYARIPKNHLIIFDIETGPHRFMTPAEKAREAARLGLECVPLIHHGIVRDFEQFKGLLERESVLGGCTIEGMVVKNYAYFTKEKKVACGKFVSERFKEIHGTEWKKNNPKNKDIIALITEALQTEARWEKAVQHLRDAGELEHSPRDIGKLIQEIPEDIKKECEGEIKDRLFAHAWPHIRRGAMRGMPEWYKKRLAASAFEHSAE